MSKSPQIQGTIDIYTMSNIPTDPNAVPTTAMPIPGVMTPQMMAMYGYQYPGGYMPAPAMPAMPMPVAPRPVIPSTAAALLGISTPSTTSNSSIPSMPMPPMAFPRPAMLQQTLSGLPPAMPTMPTMHTMPGMAGMMPGMMPGGVLPHHPTVPTSVARTMNDPNNDVTCWVEYQTDDQVKYWYNKVTQTSTYDKPFCLKTPEERSIQPCSWKEYKTAEGKSYYSNGQDTRYVYAF